MYASAIKAALFSSIVLLSTGCSTVVTKESRDTTGQFDGSWSGEVFRASSPQTAQGWTYTCSDLSQKAPMTVSDGVVSITLEDQKFSTYINSDGRFKIKMDAGRTRASSSSEIPLSNPNVRLFITGNLAKSPASGALVIGLAEIGYHGCKSKMTYTKL